MTARPRIFIDLDGTLSESSPGIVASIRAGLAAVGADQPDDLTWCVGPPLQQSFATLLGGYEARAAEALAAYRAHYDAGAMFDCKVYDGIPEALEALSAGARLFLATSKPIVFARRITARFGLDRYLETEFGSELDGTRAAKPDLLAHALAETGAGPALMIGDRRHDIEGARANGLPGIGVLWGYGGAAELTKAGADALAETPAALPALVASLLQAGTPLR